jgi:Rrf2 family protein
MVARTEPVSVRDLARFQELPERFLAKLFTRLKNAGIVEGTEGISGGFSLARAPESITVRDILEAIDPKRSLFECGEIRRHCALFDGDPPTWSVAGTCRIHLFMKEAESVLRDFLMSKSLADLGHEFEQKAPARFIRDAKKWFQDSRDERTAKKSDLTE